MQPRLWGIMILPICPGVGSRLRAYATIFHFLCVRLSMLELDLSHMAQGKKKPHSAGRRAKPQPRKTGNRAAVMAWLLSAFSTRVVQHTAFCKWEKTIRVLRETFQPKCNCFTGLETKTNQTLRSSFFIAINIYRFVICFSGNSV